MRDFGALAPHDQQTAADNQQNPGEQPPKRRFAKYRPAKNERINDAKIFKRRKIAGLGHAVGDNQADNRNPAAQALSR